MLNQEAFLCLPRNIDHSKVLVKVQEGQNQKTGAADVRPYGGREKKGNLFPI